MPGCCSVSCHALTCLPASGCLQVKIKNLGLQAAQRILSAAANTSSGLDPLLVLQASTQQQLASVLSL